MPQRLSDTITPKKMSENSKLLSRFVNNLRSSDSSVCNTPIPLVAILVRSWRSPVERKSNVQGLEQEVADSIPG